MNYCCSFVVLALFASAYVEAYEVCDPSRCKLPQCQCPETIAPISGIIPQLVAVSFDDSVVNPNFLNYYKRLLFNRKNADNCPISATFFVPHEYTDYSTVHELYSYGFEIGSHSITKNFSMEYWANATRNTIQSEMGGQREIISMFANIPKDNITGSRIPQFQVDGDETYLGLKYAGFQYDSSWPTLSSRRFFPYTLDYAGQQQCLVGLCPGTPIPGFWIVPAIDLVTDTKFECNNLLGCGVQGTTDEIFNWMKKNFDMSYHGNRAPFTLLVNSAWFQFTHNSFEAFLKFFDYLGNLKDVFIVSDNQVIEWAKNPVTADKYNSCKTRPKVTECRKVTCKLVNEKGEDRYMTTCTGSCPSRYPWLGNTMGN